MNPKPENRNPAATSKVLTRFICQELLYEYVTNRLNPERQAEMDDFLLTCRESQRELERLRNGLAYSQLAARLEVPDKLEETLLNFDPHWKKRFAAWTSRFSRQSWKWMPYVFAMVLLAVVAAVFKPWNMKFRTDVALIEQPRMPLEPDMEPPIANVADVKNPIVPEAVIASESDKATTSPSEIPQALLPPTLGPLAVNLVLPTIAIPSSAVPSAARPMAMGVPKSTAVATVAAPDSLATPTPTPVAAAGKGLLSRADLDVTDFDMAWPAIRDKIVALDGKVAGTVELGWLRRETEAYFHFSIPESNQNELEIFLKTFGPVRFSKERHPRVMPEGQIRIILTVKDGSRDGQESQAEAP